ncbi:hypothetical protein HDU67_000601 [Dinochytrium kinnereticum]|nr:hypothetical protein HDU67_000601 [Dinochytrium kinnereticum]
MASVSSDCDALASSPFAFLFPAASDCCREPSSLRVGCDNENRITSLNLTRSELSGPLPGTFLSSLTKLELLFLGANKLSGSIPPQLGELTSLVALDLGLNKLSGEIPSSLGSLSNLRSLYLGENELNGSIPSTLGDLRNIGDMFLSRNKLSGRLPDFIYGVAGARVEDNCFTPEDIKPDSSFSRHRQSVKAREDNHDSKKTTEESRPEAPAVPKQPLPTSDPLSTNHVSPLGVIQPSSPIGSPSVAYMDSPLRPPLAMSFNAYPSPYERHSQWEGVGFPNGFSSYGDTYVYGPTRTESSAMSPVVSDAGYVGGLNGGDVREAYGNARHSSVPSGVGNSYGTPSNVQFSEVPSSDARSSYLNPSDFGNVYMPPSSARFSYTPPSEVRSSYVPPSDARHSYMSLSDGRVSYVPPSNEPNVYVAPGDAKILYMPSSDLRNSYVSASDVPSPSRDITHTIPASQHAGTPKFNAMSSSKSHPSASDLDPSSPIDIHASSSTSWEKYHANGVDFLKYEKTQPEKVEKGFDFLKYEKTQPERVEKGIDFLKDEKKQPEEIAKGFDLLNEEKTLPERSGSDFDFLKNEKTPKPPQRVSSIFGGVGTTYGGGGALSRMLEVKGWTNEQVTGWLLKVGVGEEVVEVLRAGNINGYMLTVLTDAQLFELGLTSPEARRLILTVVEELHGGTGSSLRRGASATTDVLPQYLE